MMNASWARDGIPEWSELDAAFYHILVRGFLPALKGHLDPADLPFSPFVPSSAVFQMHICTGCVVLSVAVVAVPNHHNNSHDVVH
jgi:hypothetical protein